MTNLKDSLVVNLINNLIIIIIVPGFALNELRECCIDLEKNCPSLKLGISLLDRYLVDLLRLKAANIW